MECSNCGYKGEPEYGEFPVNNAEKILGVKDSNIEIWGKQHIRCPTCKNTRKITIEQWEHVKEAILYSEYCYGSPDWRTMYGKGHIKTRKAISILNGKTVDGYSIYCPVCSWGEAGGLQKGKAEELRKLLVESFSVKETKL